MSDFYIQQIFTMIISCGCIKKMNMLLWGGTTDGTYCAVQSNIQISGTKTPSLMFYPQLHISDCSSTQKNKH